MTTEYIYEMGKAEPIATVTTESSYIKVALLSPVVRTIRSFLVGRVRCLICNAMNCTGDLRCRDCKRLLY